MKQDTNMMGKDNSQNTGKNRQNSGILVDQEQILNQGQNVKDGIYDMENNDLADDLGLQKQENNQNLQKGTEDHKENSEFNQNLQKQNLTEKTEIKTKQYFDEQCHPIFEETGRREAEFINKSPLNLAAMEQNKIFTSVGKKNNTERHNKMNKSAAKKGVQTSNSFQILTEDQEVFPKEITPPELNPDPGENRINQAASES